MMEEDRIKWYNWNLACIILTAVPLTWMYTVNYRTCAEVRNLSDTPENWERVIAPTWWVSCHVVRWSNLFSLFENLLPGL